VGSMAGTRTLDDSVCKKAFRVRMTAKRIRGREIHIRSGGCFFGGRSVKGIAGTRTFDDAVCKEGI